IWPNLRKITSKKSRSVKRRLVSIKAKRAYEWQQSKIRRKCLKLLQEKENKRKKFNKSYLKPNQTDGWLRINARPFRLPLRFTRPTRPVQPVNKNWMPSIKTIRLILSRVFSVRRTWRRQNLRQPLKRLPPDLRNTPMFQEKSQRPTHLLRKTMSIS